MIERLIAFSVQRRAWVLLLACGWAIAGIWAIRQTPVDAVPDISENQVIVFAEWSGHAPEEVEQHVTYPLSLSFQGLQGVRAVRGSSDVGYSMLYLIFDDDVSFTEARDRAREQLAASPIDLPDGVVARLAADGIPTGQIYWYTVEGDGFDLGELRALQDWSIAPQLTSVPGVAEVASVGGFVREVSVQVDLPALTLAGLSLRDVNETIAAARASSGGHVVLKGNAEFVVQVEREADDDDPFGMQSLERLTLPKPDGSSVQLGEVARVTLAAAPRRGMLEKDGNEVVGGVVHLRYGHNPLEVTRLVKEKLREIQAGVPAGVRIRPCYDRTPLIMGAVGTVTRTLIEAILVACICVVVVMRHLRASLVVALTLPLAVIGAFVFMWLMRVAGVADVQTNIMSLAGIVISIGVLVDSSIVLSENVMHELRRIHGDRPVAGNVDAAIIQACQTVGRPVFFSVLIMLISFLPVFALGGVDGKMYSPLAWTKTLALISAAVLALTVVPALCAVLIRGRIRDEADSPIVRTMIDVYRPVLTYLLDHPAPLIYVLCATLLLATIPLGHQGLMLGVLSASILLMGMVSRTFRGRTLSVGTLILLALLGGHFIRPLGMELRLPLDEGMVMDMPITIPRASIAQTADDVKARDMVLCRFPEVHMVVGKGGRADTPFDPAPLDMIETMIEFRPREWWPRRLLSRGDAEQQAGAVLRELIDRELITAPEIEARAPLLSQAVDSGLMRYDAVMREVCHLHIQQFFRSLSGDVSVRLVEEVEARVQRDNRLARELSEGDRAALGQDLPADLVAELALGPSIELVEELCEATLSGLEKYQLLKPVEATGSAGLKPADIRRVQQAVEAEYRERWHAFVPELNSQVETRAAALWTRIIAEELILLSEIRDESLAERLREVYALRYAPRVAHHGRAVAPAAGDTAAAGGGHHHGSMPGVSEVPFLEPHPAFDEMLKELSGDFAATMSLSAHDTESLTGFGGEMDRALQMPGWTNVWTKPIQNRVDMLATGVNAEIGVRVVGRNLDDVVRASEDVAAALSTLAGSVDVVADPIRGKGYLRITPDSVRAAELGVSLGDLNDVVEAALSGKVVADELVGRERVPIRVRCTAVDALDEETIRRLPIPVHRPREGNNAGSLNVVTLDSVASVDVTDGPATIKSENGWLRNYVRLNVVDRDPVEFVEEARRVVAATVDLPEGIFVEWTGQFEHSLATRQTLFYLMPVVFGLIIAFLYWTYRDWIDACLMMLAIPGALAGGVLCQALFGFPFSVAVGMGYIACFGMAAATGIVMLVYLRGAVAQAGALENMSLNELREATLKGAVHRLRPKLLTEATTILGLAPILWSTGVGADVIRPMAAPVLGGLLVADEVIDLLLPILFYHVRRRRWLRIHSQPGLQHFGPSAKFSPASRPQTPAVTLFQESDS
jgi:Cu(I)/Ag(I) efflux system membrane protein CusA/SilA